MVVLEQCIRTGAVWRKPGQWHSGWRVFEGRTLLGGRNEIFALLYIRSFLRVGLCLGEEMKYLVHFTSDLFWRLDLLGGRNEIFGPLYIRSFLKVGFAWGTKWNIWSTLHQIFFEGWTLLAGRNEIFGPLHIRSFLKVGLCLRDEMKYLVHFTSDLFWRLDFACGTKWNIWSTSHQIFFLEFNFCICYTSDAQSGHLSK